MEPTQQSNPILERKARISARKNRQKQMAELHLQGVPYKEIHDLVTPPFHTKNPEHKAQVVYSSLITTGGQNALAEALSFSESDINTRISQSLTHFDPQKPSSGHVKVLEIGARVKGMMKDVQESRSVRVNVEVKAGPELASKLLQALKQANSGQDDPLVKQGKS